MSDELTRRVDRRAEKDHYTLEAMSHKVDDLIKRVNDYRTEAITCNIELKSHVKACDRRYQEMRDDRSGAVERIGSASFTRKTWASWIGNRILEKLFDYILITLVLLVVFALAHGAHIFPQTP